MITFSINFSVVLWKVVYKDWYQNVNSLSLITLIIQVPFNIKHREGWKNNEVFPSIQHPCVLNFRSPRYVCVWEGCFSAHIMFFIWFSMIWGTQSPELLTISVNLSSLPNVSVPQFPHL